MPFAIKLHSFIFAYMYTAIVAMYAVQNILRSDRTIQPNNIYLHTIKTSPATVQLCSYIEMYVCMCVSMYVYGCRR